MQIHPPPHIIPILPPNSKLHYLIRKQTLLPLANLFHGRRQNDNEISINRVWNKVANKVSDEEVWVLLVKNIWDGLNEAFGEGESNSKL